LNFTFSPEELALQKEVREFLKKEMPPQVTWEVEHEKGWEGPYTREFVKKLGAKHWLTAAWPKEYGGLGANYMQRYIIGEELSAAGGPRTLIGSTMAGPTILLYGSEEQKKEYLPRIARGEIEFALGYTEPEAGSDMANLDIRAVDMGDHFVINGQKLFNTGCHYSDYHWLGARTDPKAPKHKGISLIIVDFKTPGISLDPIITMADYRTNAVYYDNVKVPKKNLVGELNKGWTQIATAVDLERTYETGGIERKFHHLLEYCRNTRRKGQPLTEDIEIRHKLSKMAVEIEVLKLLAVRLACILNKGKVPNYEAAMAKLFGSELEQRLSEMGMEILGLYGQLREGDPRAPMDGSIELYHRMTVRWTIVRGSSEIMRNLIANRGLNMPRG
jgi:3-oxocholest-4-en-26-oyl-CoA dehydrogenase alpha subunit